MPNYTLQILRLLSFAGLMLLLGSVASASAETVGERAKKDPSFKIYPVIFSVTVTSNSTPPAVRVVGKGQGKNYRKISEAEAAKIIPAAWIKAVKKIIQAAPSKPKMKDGTPVEVFTYFFYVPERPNIVVSDLDKPLDKQPREPQFFDDSSE
jgi:hypothetical protein